MGLDPKHTEWWINALISGENLTENDPVLRLRNRFITSGKRVIISRVEQAALIIKSWNLSREGKPVRLLQWRGAGPNPEAFPVLGEREETPGVVAGGPDLERLVVPGPDTTLQASPAAAALTGDAQQPSTTIGTEAQEPVVEPVAAGASPPAKGAGNPPRAERRGRPGDDQEGGERPRRAETRQPVSR